MHWRKWYLLLHQGKVKVNPSTFGPNTYFELFLFPSGPVQTQWVQVPPFLFKTNPSTIWSWHHSFSVLQIFSFMSLIQNQRIYLQPTFHYPLSGLELAFTVRISKLNILPSCSFRFVISIDCYSLHLDILWEPQKYHSKTKHLFHEIFFSCGPLYLCIHP